MLLFSIAFSNFPPFANATPEQLVPFVLKFLSITLLAKSSDLLKLEQFSILRVSSDSQFLTVTSVKLVLL